MRYSGSLFYGVAVLLILLSLNREAKAQDNFPTPSDIPEKVSLLDAVARAKQTNLLPQSAQPRLQGASARLSGASRQPNPTLALARPFGLSNTGRFGEDVIASQTLELPDKVRYWTQSAWSVQGVVRDAQKIMQAETLPSGVTYVISGQYQSPNESFSTLFTLVFAPLLYASFGSVKARQA